jgi:ubiquinone/menaquinone biosynthesis C-methylase UbiE
METRTNGRVRLSDAREAVYNVPYETYHTPKKIKFAFLVNRLGRYLMERQRVVYDLLAKGQRFLDVGCGDGHLVTMAKSKFDQVYGVDFCSAHIEKAKKSIENILDKEKIFFLYHDVEKGLPFDNSFFDTISCVSVLEHIFSPPMLLDEIRRVLKDEGQFIVQVPNYAWLPWRLQLLSGRLPMTGGVDRFGIDWLHVHNFTESTLRSFLESKGFRVVSVASSGIFAKYRRWWLSVLSADIIMKAARVKKSVQVIEAPCANSNQ